jgi:hypothetical protein
MRKAQVPWPSTPRVDLNIFRGRFQASFCGSTQSEIHCDFDRNRLTLWLSALRSWLSALSPRIPIRPQVFLRPLLRHSPFLAPLCSPLSALSSSPRPATCFRPPTVLMYTYPNDRPGCRRDRDVTPISRAVRGSPDPAHAVVRGQSLSKPRTSEAPENRFPGCGQVPDG